MFKSLFYRRKRVKHYQQIRAELESLSDADLADIGIKRYQLATIARFRALR